MNLIKDVQGISPFLTKRYSYITDIIERVLKRFRYNEVIVSNLEYGKDKKEGLTLPDVNNNGRNIMLQTDLINNFNKLVKYHRLCVGNKTAKLYTTGINFNYNHNYEQNNIVDIEYFNSDSILSVIEIIDIVYTIAQRLPIDCKPLMYIGTTGCKECRKKYEESSIFQKQEGVNSITLKEQYLEHLNTKHTIYDFLCEDCKETIEWVISTLKYYSMDFEVKYELYDDKKDFFSNYDGIIFDVVPYYNGPNHFMYGGQFNNDIFDHNERCIVDLDSIILYIKDYIWDLNNNQFNKSNSTLVIPYSPELDGIAYTLAHIKRFDKFNRNVDIDISDRPLIEKIRSAKKFYNGYYLVKSEDCIEYYNFSSDEPFSTRTLDEFIDWFNDEE